MRSVALELKGAILVDGFSVTFMKLGKNKLDPTDRYESEWVGGPGGFREERIGGNGGLITGIVGTENQKDCTGLGLSLNEFGTKQSLPRAQDSRPPAATAGSTPAATAGSTPAATAGSPPAHPGETATSSRPRMGNLRSPCLPGRVRISDPRRPTSRACSCRGICRFVAAMTHVYR